PADRSRSRERVRLDLPGSLLLTACPLLFVYAAVEAGEPGTNPWVSVAALVGSVLAAVGFVWVESKSQNPLVPLAFFADRARLRIGPLGPGLTLLPLAVALIAASVLVPRLLGRWGARACVLVGLTAAAGAMAVVALVAVLGGGAAWLLPAMLLIAAGMGFGL